MVGVKGAFSGFSVNDLVKAKAFYTQILGLQVEEQVNMGLTLHLPGGSTVFVYPKENHVPATFTVLNFAVENIDEAMDELIEKGVHFEHYEGMPQDEKGVLRGLSVKQGPDIAWFTDPAGNIFSLLQESKE